MSDSGPLSVLVVEDEPDARTVFLDAIAQLGWMALPAGTAQEALQTVTTAAPELILLDIGLPDASGLEVLRTIRRSSMTPVIVLSATSTDDAKIALLDAGADDYLVKPIGMAELQARLRVHARRLESERRATDELHVRLGPVEIDLMRRRVLREGEEIRLTPTEWSLLRALARRRDTPVSPEVLWQEVWGREFGDARLNVRVHVLHLRRKIEPVPSAPALLVNVPGVGYMLRPP